VITISLEVCSEGRPPDLKSLGGLQKMSRANQEQAAEGNRTVARMCLANVTATKNHLDSEAQKGGGVFGNTSAAETVPSIPTAGPWSVVHRTRRLDQRDKGWEIQKLGRGVSPFKGGAENLRTTISAPNALI